MKILEKNRGIKPLEMGLGSEILDMIPKVQATK